MLALHGGQVTKIDKEGRSIDVGLANEVSKLDRVAKDDDIWIVGFRWPIECGGKDISLLWILWIKSRAHEPNGFTVGLDRTGRQKVPLRRRPCGVSRDYKRRKCGRSHSPNP